MPATGARVVWLHPQQQVLPWLPCTFQALQLVTAADVKAQRAELHLPKAEVAAQHAETAQSALLQARRDAALLRGRAEQLLRDAERKAQVGAAGRAGW